MTPVLRNLHFDLSFYRVEKPAFYPVAMDGFSLYLAKLLKKVNQSHYRPGQAHRVPGT
jgi:hypothetical protein